MRAVRPGGIVAPLAGCVVLASASLALPAMLGYDPWAWQVWGREVTRGELSTDGGPTWKPLPVLGTTVLAPFGDVAPDLWLVLTRTGGLLGLVLAYRLAARFGGSVAGVVAASTLLLTPDGEARWLRLMLQGNVEPPLIALCLLAVERHLDGRYGQAVTLGGAAALLRPEAGPLLALYAVALLWREPGRWRVAVPVLAVVPLLWLGGDWWASGDPLAGSDRAQVLEGTTTERVTLAAQRIAEMVIVPVWFAAAGCVAWAAHRRRMLPVALGAGALLWAAVVALMAVWFGYAALSRFLAPAAAVLCVLAGIAVGRAVTAPHRALSRLAVAAVLLAVTVPLATARAGWLPEQLAAAAARAELDDQLDRTVVRAGGRDGLLGCGALAIDSTRPAVEARPALAWKIDVPLATVEYSLGRRPGVTLALTGGALDAELAAAADTVVIARTPGWTGYATRCRPPAGVARFPESRGAPE